MSHFNECLWLEELLGRDEPEGTTEILEGGGTWNAPACPDCHGIVFIDGDCLRCVHGCWKCGDRIDFDCFCSRCSEVTLRCHAPDCHCGRGVEAGPGLPSGLSGAPGQPEPELPLDEFAPAQVEAA